MTTPTYRHAGHSISLLHAHLVFMTKDRHALFTGAMPTFIEHIMRGVCAELDVELIEFNSEADHMHLLVAYPLTQAISTLLQRLKGRTAHAVRREKLRRLCPYPHPRPPLLAVLLRLLLWWPTAIYHQAIR